MPLYNELSGDITEVDVIIAGGGTAGCIVATRLAEADPQLSILVIEGGPNNDLPSILYPVMFMANLQPETGTAIFYKGNKSSGIADREAIVASGGLLGGGSSVNLMTYTRAQKSDLDAWNIPGWSADEMIPYMKKFETYHGRGNSKTHGHDGPIHVSSGPFSSPRVSEDFIAASAMFGYPEVDDLSDLKTNNAVQRNLRYLTPDGKRQDVATCYLKPKLQDTKYPNLHVVVNTKVLRVLIENKKAVGVEFEPKLAVNNATISEQSTRCIKARKMVVLSCGALGTPLVLERSGVGNPKLLEVVGIPLVADLPGVGQGYQDHQLLLYPYRSSLNPDETLDALAGGRIDPMELIKNNDPILGWNGQEVISRIRPADEEIVGFGPRFEEVWNRNYKPFPDRPLVHLSLFPGCAEDPKTIPVGQYFSLTAFTVHPESRGHIHITGPKLIDPIDFEPGFFNDQHQVDISKHVWVYKKQREIVRRMKTYRGELALGHPPFPITSAAACIEISEPLRDVQDLKYSAEDDKIIKQWAREHVGTTWHSLGTCKMAPAEQLGVVDSSLGVRGIEGLKIADLSVVPINVSANSNNMALTIGEKAADIFIRELNIMTTEV